MLKVFITIDTEVWPLTPHWRAGRLCEDIKRDLYGITPEGEFGTIFQADLLHNHGLKGVFFVEPLFSEIAGGQVLRGLIDHILSRGHEVQLHPHPEWLAWMEAPFLAAAEQPYLKDFSLNDQLALIERGIQHLKAAGVTNACAFRAGDYAANSNTLCALAKAGIAYDSSHNATYLGTLCHLHTEQGLAQPRMLDGVMEIPITVFSDWPGHFRHAQLCACSSRELEHVLDSAWEQGWYSFVLVSHSFELIKNRRRDGRHPTADGIVIRRFDRLCRFLADNAERFQTCGFEDLKTESIPSAQPAKPLSSRMGHTAWRFVEQLIRRF